MYVTRPLSLVRRCPDALSEPPPEGPNSGYLVIQDEEAEDTCCFGLCENNQILDLPFPQNKEIGIIYTSDYMKYVVLIPELNQPLSSNRYYTIESSGKHKGKAYANSKEEDRRSCLCCRFVQDKKPAPLDPHDIYQQFVIHSSETSCCSGYFYAKSVAQDGYPPRFLKTKGWVAYTRTPKYLYLDEAQGLNVSLRSCLPDFNFNISQENSGVVVVGKWYCPFMFVREGKLGDHMKKSMYYKMTLQQRWKRIHSCENDQSQGNTVVVDVNVQNEVISIGGGEASETYVKDGVMWIQGFSDGGKEKEVGLNLVIVERIKWEQERVGWVHVVVDGRQVRIQRVEEFKDVGPWMRFGCYVLVETFVLESMNGRQMLAYEFRHTHQVRCKWE